MNYTVNLEHVRLVGKNMVITVSGEINDELIRDGVFSKPKLIMLFDNGKEDRRIPLVLSECGYYGSVCRFRGEYTYMLDMLFWRTRGENLPFQMKFALSYGNAYYDSIALSEHEPLIDREDNGYEIAFDRQVIGFTPSANFRRIHPVLKAAAALLRLVLNLVFTVVAVCLLPLFFIESLLAAAGLARLCVPDTGSTVGKIIGHTNHRFAMLSNYKFTIQGFNRVMIILFYKLFSLKKVKPNKISFISARRTDISGNFAFVYGKLKDRDDLDIQFVLNDKTVRQLNLADIVKFTRACADSKVIVLDEFTPQIHYIDLKPETTLIQLWHACGAFKTFGFTRLGKPKGSPQPTRNHRNYDYVTVSSEYCKRCHSEGFGIPYDNVVPTGIPRTDVFFDEEYAKNVREKFYTDYPALRGKKLILFAPTFRGDVKETAHYPFEMFNVAAVCDSLPDDYVIIIKHHPFITEKHPVPAGYEHRVLDMSENTEINDLLFVTDLIITDYSSLVFEASLLKIPMVFYVYDLDEYIKDRDFYFDLRLNSPGKLVFSESELIETIRSGEFDEERIEPFKNMFFDKTDGRSTERVAELILNSLNLGK